MPNKTYDNSTFTKILVRTLRIFCLGVFLNFFGKIQLFGLDGIELLLGRLALTAGVGYALMGNFNLKIKTYLALAILGAYLFLAYSGIEAYQDVRMPGVLQRIAIVYFVTSLLYLKTNQKTQLLVASVILLGYWALMALVPVPGIGAANIEKGTNLAAWLDSILLKGHMWGQTKTWDPEGFLSTLPSIATGILGLFVGQIINLPQSKLEIIKKIGITSIILIALGLLWSLTFPLNKSLWTSSYVLYTAGLATLCLTILYYAIDVANYKKGTRLFSIWGVNPMIVFFLSGIIPQALRMITFQNPKIATEQINLSDYLYSYGVAPFFSNPLNASLAFALLYVLFWTCILWVFHKNKLIFKV